VTAHRVLKIAQRRREPLMALQRSREIDLPPHTNAGGFDHAAIHAATARLYVAHTANDALDVIDGVHDRYLHSIPNLASVAGALVSDHHNLVFTSNRGENTVGIFSPEREAKLVKVAVGVKPNGLAFAPVHGLLLAANVGDPAVADSYTVSLVDVAHQRLIASIPVPGRTRWTIFDEQSATFFVNIAKPAQIVAITATEPTRIAHIIDVSCDGPHGLDFDAATHRLFCACDGQALITLDAHSGVVINRVPLSGVPDVVFFNAALHHLYVAIGDPGVIDVFDTKAMTLLESVPTEPGAHTLAFDATQNKVYAFLPQTHRALVFGDA
jgi:DNA-binding beta-propeller fold protein YncE